MNHQVLEQYYHEYHTKRRKYGFSVFEAERAALFGAWIGRGHDVLDIGCRDGILTRHFLKGNRVIGVDVDSEALARAREHASAEDDFRTECLDANNPLPFPDACFDRILMGEVLEHTVFPDCVVREVYRCLRPGGCFMGSVPNDFRLRNRLRFLQGQDIFSGEPTHLHHFHTETLRRLLAETGFERIELGSLCGRFRRLHPFLFGLSLTWRCWKPR
jgi:SAM-dependent methyltransferase